MKKALLYCSPHSAAGGHGDCRLNEGFVEPSPACSGEAVDRGEYGATPCAQSPRMNNDTQHVMLYTPQHRTPQQ